MYVKPKYPLDSYTSMNAAELCTCGCKVRTVRTLKHCLRIATLAKITGPVCYDGVRFLYWFSHGYLDALGIHSCSKRDDAHSYIIFFVNYFKYPIVSIAIIKHHSSATNAHTTRPQIDHKNKTEMQIRTFLYPGKLSHLRERPARYRLLATPCFHRAHRRAHLTPSFRVTPRGALHSRK